MSNTSSVPAEGAQASTRLYRAVWRWHFYAGLLCCALPARAGRLWPCHSLRDRRFARIWDWTRVAPKGEMLPPSKQAEFALAAHPGSTVGQYIAPWGNDYVSLVRVDHADGNRMLAVNPYDGSIVHGPFAGGNLE